MKAIKSYIIMLLILPLISLSCAAPKLTNNDRGRYRYSILDDPSDVLEVTVTPTPLPDAPPKVIDKSKTFFDLRDSIPITFLKVIGHVAKSPDDVIKAINTPLSTISKETKLSGEKNESLDNKTAKIRLYFSSIQSFYNHRKILHPNTKLEYLNTKVKILSPNAVIQTIDRLENEFEQIDMGTLERSNEVKFSSTATGAIGGEIGRERIKSSDRDDTSTSDTEDASSMETGSVSKLTITNKSGNKAGSTSKNNTSAKAEAKAELQYANNESIKEALALKLRKMKTSFSFSPNHLTVSQRGYPLVGISDNVFVTVTIMIKNEGKNLATNQVMQFTNLANNKGQIQTFDSVSRKPIEVRYAPCISSSDIMLGISYSGAIRATRNLIRGRNISEFDDKVTYYKFANSGAESTFKINKSDFCSSVYRIVAITDKNEQYILNTGKSTPKEVLLYSEHQPAIFFEWLRNIMLSKDPKVLESSKGDLFFLKAVGNPEKIYVSKERMTDEEGVFQFYAACFSI